MARRKSMAVRRVSKNEERKRPGIFTRLKDQEKMVGYALFEPDAELEDNAGFYEYYSHYDPSGPATVPCLGEDCLMCERNDQPSTRALTLWYFPEAPQNERLKIFTANGGTVDDLADEAEELGGIMGRKYRIKRRGSGTKTRYRITNLNDKLKSAEIKKLLKELPDAFDLEALVEKQAKAQYERLRAVEALEDDDDDIEEVEDDEDEDEDEVKSKSKSRKGKAVEDDDDDEDEDEEDEDDEDEDEDEEEEEAPEPIEEAELELLSVSKAKNSVKVEHEDETITLVGGEDVDVSEFKKGDTAVVSAEWDDEDEGWTLTAIEAPEEEDEDEEDEEDEDEDGETTEIENHPVTITKVDEENEILTVKSADKELGTFELYLPRGMDLDFDDFAKGQKLTITAALDDENDWVLTEEPEIQKAKASSRKKK